MGVEQKSANGSDEFPVGMRVLAVDDDPACLKILEALLRKCEYHVTTTNQAVLALQMLRENKDKFDLVISDVCMPDMDGFKLLELVGLEMDLPVIMLSAYGDTAHVTKGIYHGACDYLLKPVRDEELKLIWQHVVRKKMDKSRRDEVGDGFSNQNGKLNKKSKDPSAQKKPRLSWTKELHSKFVAAVNHLGVDNAFPTRIVKMMKEENVTKENVASHLQKYRGYLKRISHEASMVISPNGRSDSAYMKTGCVTLPTFVGFEKASLGSFPPSSAAGMGIFGSRNSSDPLNLQGATNVEDDSMAYPISSIFLSERTDVCSSSYSFSGYQNAPPNLALPFQLCNGNQSGAVQSSPIQSSSYVLNDSFNPMSSNVGESMIFRLKNDMVYQQHDVSCSSIDNFLGPRNVDPQNGRHGPESFVNYGHNYCSRFTGVSRSVDPLSSEHNEDEMTMMPLDSTAHSSCAGSLEDIVTAMMKQEKGKSKVISKEDHSGYNAFCHSTGDCIYT